MKLACRHSRGKAQREGGSQVFVAQLLKNANDLNGCVCHMNCEPLSFSPAALALLAMYGVRSRWR